MFNYGKAKVRDEEEWWGGGDNGGTSEKSEKKVVLCWDKFNNEKRLEDI